jgi:hypothetical protein
MLRSAEPVLATTTAQKPSQMNVTSLTAPRPAPAASGSSVTHTAGRLHLLQGLHETSCLCSSERLVCQSVLTISVTCMPLALPGAEFALDASSLAAVRKHMFVDIRSCGVSCFAALMSHDRVYH